jgi:outer membrane protein TolC
LGNWTGPSASLTYGYERPWGNNAALGLAQQQEAQRQQAELAREDLERRLRSGVVQAFDRYTRALTQVRRAREAVVLYLGSVEDERERLAAGTTTLINLLLTEERATAALFAAVAAEQSYAAALLDLRFSTGLLLRREGERFVFRDRELMELSAEELTRW